MDSQKITELIKNKKLDEAKKILEDYIKNVELTDEEKGAVYVNLASIYLEASNNLNREYEKFLDGILSLVSEIDSMKGELSDKIDLAAVRSQIKG